MEEMTEQTTQQAVYAAVRDRGYVDPWTPRQFIARNVVKLLEEIGELCHYVTVGLMEHGANDAYVKGVVAGICAKRAFDEPMAWENHIKLDIPKLKSEAADAQVVLFCLAEALEFDIAQAALDKARGDVERGVRGDD